MYVGRRRNEAEEEKTKKKTKKKKKTTKKKKMVISALSCSGHLDVPVLRKRLLFQFHNRADVKQELLIRSKLTRW